MFGYTVYQKNQFQEANDGVAIAVRSTLRHIIIDDYDENYLAVKIDTNLGQLVLATGYQPPRRPILPLQSMLQIFRRNLPVIFIGDLNARHSLLGHQNNPNSAGEAIATLLRRGTVQHHGPDFKTFITTRAKGTPDIILTNDNIVHNMHIKQGPITTSDHIPVLVTLSSSPIQVPITPRFNKKLANWDGFKAELEPNEPPEMEGKLLAEIDTEMDKWFRLVERAMGNNIPITGYVTLPHPQITNEIRQTINNCKLVQQIAARQGWNPALRNMMAGLQTSLQTTFKEARQENWNNLILNTDIQHGNPEAFWKNVKNMMGTTKENIVYLLDPQGNKLKTQEEQVAEFKRVWSKVYNMTANENADFCQQTEIMVEEYLDSTERHSTYERVSLERLSPEDELLRPIKPDDILLKIRQQKSRKAPGKSKIDKEILTKLPRNMIKSLTSILNACLAAGYFPDRFKIAIIKLILKSGKSPTNSNNYRPISLLETVGKIFEKLLNERFRNFLEQNDKFNKKQHAYRKNRGTATAIALAYETIATCQQNREQCNVVFRDVSKAFDRVWHRGLKYKLCQLEMPRSFTALLCNFLDGRKAIIQVGDHQTEPFQINCGVPQGSAIAPTLYSYYTSDLGDLPHCNYVIYADDVTQIIKYPGKSKHFLKLYTERAILALNNYEKRWKIKTNQDKFQILHISKKNPLPINIDGTDIRFTNKVKLLGLTLKRTGIGAHVKEKKQQANVALKKLKRFSNMRDTTKLHLFKALIRPILEYPVIPLNTLRASNWKELQRIQNKSLRWVAGERPPYTRDSATLHQEYDIRPLNQRNFEQGYKFWEKMRINFEEELAILREYEVVGTHAWWPLAYLPEEAVLPPPIIV